ncbi:nitroreductase family protein [Halopolyspora algeriensis]|uniref:Nitroreductase family protein n=1 Tax=Halopolyspora algeriensis TaxID=1500506 RepID=A0A368VRT4_9ACTN|nr:nitroreductase family protein [Halopolyspora algeriensis]RCW44451.1 nitroreductase family protein [Halopolyspora algeriensis]TQM55812.1 nitroreductase family protein [Halopolyspora algeriensis]
MDEFGAAHPSDGEPAENGAWSPDEVAVLTEAMDQAPSVHNIQPWSLGVKERTATIYEQVGPELSRHDPEGRDRRISCGAALTNLVLAVADLGWEPQVRRDPEGADRPEAVAAVTGHRRGETGDSESRRYEAIARRASYRQAFHDRAVPEDIRQRLLSAATSSTVQAEWVGSADVAALARLLIYAASVHRGDRSYQRELAMWTLEEGVPAERGIPAEALGSEGVPAVGLATSEVRIPDEHKLAERIAKESILVLTTPSDEPGDHLHVGEAMELAWLEAVSQDTAASVMTQPLRLSEVRTRLVEMLGISGVPQVLMRFGYPRPAE